MPKQQAVLLYDHLPVTCSINTLIYAIVRLLFLINHLEDIEF